MESEPTTQNVTRLLTRPRTSRVPAPVTDDLTGLIDVDGRFKAALAGWEHLSPQDRRRINKELWLAVQGRDRRRAAARQQASKERRAAIAARRAADADAAAADLRARTCGACFTVRTPAGTCTCTD